MKQFRVYDSKGSVIASGQCAGLDYADDVIVIRNENSEIIGVLSIANVAAVILGS